MLVGTMVASFGSRNLFLSNSHKYISDRLAYEATESKQNGDLL